MTDETLKEVWEKRHENRWAEATPPSRISMNLVEKYRDRLGKQGIDLGCGYGRYLLWLAEIGFAMTGVELTGAGVERARQKLAEHNLTAELIKADFHDLALPDESYDFAIAAQSFQFGDWQSAVRKFEVVTRLIRKHGLIFIRVRSTERTLNNPIFIPEEHHPLDSQRQGMTYKHEREGKLVTCHSYSIHELRYLARVNHLEFMERPFDARTINDGKVEPGQWNVVMRKEVKA